MAVVEALYACLVTIVAFLFLILYFAPDQYDPYATDLQDTKGVNPSLVDKDGWITDKKERARVARKDKDKFPSSVTVVVMGDIGRSPRMQYHALSLAQRGAYVIVVGYVESPILPELKDNVLVKIARVRPAPAWLNTKSRLLFLVLGPLKVFWQGAALLNTLGYRTRSTKFILVQNPPSLPVLAVSRYVAVLRNSHLVIDWHNFGWSLLALKFGKSHPLVAISEFYERRLAEVADYHLTVTDAMAKWMHRELEVDAVTLHDRPAAAFVPVSSKQRGTVLNRLSLTRSHAKHLTDGKTRLVVSATSWTADEDFELLLDALVLYSDRAARDALPRLLIVITGKGPLLDHYMARIERLARDGKLERTIVVTGFLSLPDYAALLGVADLGVCLHKSSSGLDLPMKVLDMFGCGLPVLGYSAYESWAELVTEGKNGRGFTSAEELAGSLADLLGSGDDARAALATLRSGAAAESKHKWDAEWERAAGPIFFGKTSQYGPGEAKKLK